MQVLAVIRLNSADLTEPPEIQYIDSLALPQTEDARIETLKAREDVMKVLIKWACRVWLAERDNMPNSVGPHVAAPSPERMRVRCPLKTTDAMAV